MSNTHISTDDLHQFHTHFHADPKNRLAMNAVAKNGIHAVTVNRDVVMNTDHTFSHMLKSNDITAQNASGRCWCFAGLNLFRVESMKALGLEKFELSQVYTMFWDKLEKSNYFLETILQTLEEPVDGRLLMFLLQNPIQDGGQWDMFVNLIKKYGVVPKTVMPETESSGNSRFMNALITTKLREFAAELRHLHQKGTPEAGLRQRKTEQLNVVYRMLCIHLGEPPREFYWQWRDKDNNFHRNGRISPQTFFEQYSHFALDETVCLIHCPTPDKPFNRMYTIQYLGNVIEGHIVRYLNVDISVFKKAAVDMLKDGKPVWFGCDVGKMLERDLGIMDMNLHDYELTYGVPFQADKAERVMYGQSLMTHAMVFTGVDLDEAGNPRKWRVENSWGDKIGDKGFLVMSDAWFDEYMYEVVVEQQYVPAELRQIFTTPPTVLPPWDPMGALATAV